MKKKTAYLGMFTTLALIAGYVEAMIPFDFGIPGIKLGLPNLIIVIVLYRMGVKDAFVVSVLRIVLSGFLFGNVFAIVYSLSGGLLSLFLMTFLRKTKKFSIMSVSIVGGISHNLGQVLMAVCLLENINIMLYFPALMAAGAVTGLLIGIGSREVLKRLPIL